MIDYDKSMLVGAKIINVRRMTKGELNAHYWHSANPVYVLELDNGTAIYPSRDFEGNDGGVLFGVTENEECFSVCERKAVDTSKMDNDEFGAYLRQNSN